MCIHKSPRNTHGDYAELYGSALTAADSCSKKYVTVCTNQDMFHFCGLLLLLSTVLTLQYFSRIGISLHMCSTVWYCMLSEIND